jgi:hypothetical protein
VSVDNLEFPLFTQTPEFECHADIAPIGALVRACNVRTIDEVPEIS